MSIKSHTFAYTMSDAELEKMRQYINDATVDDKVDSPNFYGYSTLNLDSEIEDTKEVFKIVGVDKNKVVKTYLTQETLETEE